MANSETDSTTFAHIGGLGYERNVNITDLDHLSIGDGDGENTFYPSLDDEDMASQSFEPMRRRRFATSVYSASTGSSSSYYMASRRHDPAGRAGGRGGGNGSIFSSEGDGMTKASRTSSGSVARPVGHVANLETMVEDEDDEPQMPELLTVEPVAEPQIAEPHHWYHAGSTPMATGSMASSATAMANVASSSSSGSTAMGESFTSSRGSGDPTALVAIMPCELQPYTGCPRTFNLLASGAGIDEWADHSAKDHLAMHFPIKANCWFCAKPYRVAPGSGREAEVYKRRMRHIARHFLHNEILPEMRRRDPDLIRHLRDRGILQDGEDYAGNDAPDEHGMGGEEASRRPRVMSDTRGPVTISTVPVKRLRLQDVHVEVAGRRRRRD